MVKLRSVPSCDVACFGEILWDIYELGPDKAGKQMLQRELGGAPANVATGLARMGVRSSVIGGVGRDRFGAALVAHLAADGVETKHIPVFDNRTGVTFVANDADGEPSFLFYRHDSADMAMTEKHVTRAMSRATWILIGTSTLVSKGLGDATRRFVSEGLEQGAHLFVDLNVRAHLWPNKKTMEREIRGVLEQATIVKASVPDMAALGWSVTQKNAGDFAPAAAWVTTRGAEPASVYLNGLSVKATTETRNCYEATGAGDAFISGLLATLVGTGSVPGTAAWNSAKCWTEALRIGHILGGKAVSRIGAVAGLVRLDHARSRIEKLRRSLA